MDLFTKTNADFRDFRRKIKQHNIIQKILSVVLIIALFYTSINVRASDETISTLVLVEISAYFLTLSIIGMATKIYSFPAALLYILWVVIISVLLWVFLLKLIGYYTFIVFPVLLLFIGPVYNRFVARTHYPGKILKFKNHCTNNLEWLYESLNNTKHFETQLDENKIDASLVGRNMSYSSRKGLEDYIISAVMKFNNAAIVIIHNSRSLHSFKIENQKISILSISSGNHKVIVDCDQTSRIIAAFSNERRISSDENR